MFAVVFVKRRRISSTASLRMADYIGVESGISAVVVDLWFLVGSVGLAGDLYVLDCVDLIGRFVWMFDFQGP